MDTIRREVLEEMARNGRSYRHEVKSIAEELLKWRAGVDPTAFDGMTILVPRTLLAEGPDGGLALRTLAVGQSKFIRFEPNYGNYVYAIVHRIPNP